MTNKVQYKTKQGDKMLEFLEANEGKHFTVPDVCAYFRQKGDPIGTTTVYRQLDKLITNGMVKKYVFDEQTSACFEYVKENEENPHQDCYHLKCEKCGKLIHLECDEITEFEHHVSKEHGFKIDSIRTVFYGVCNECGEK